MKNHFATGRPSTLHLWWAHHLLAAARAVIFPQMVDDPSAHPDLFKTEEARRRNASGHRALQWSIRIHDQWRVCFQWEESGATQVEIVDYHS